MSRPIDYDEFKWRLMHWYDKKGWAHDVDKTEFDLTEIDEAAEKTPTLDTVKHGRWIKGEWISRQTNERRSGITCSRCNVSFFQRYEDSENFMPNYCPNCGAKMDEEEDDETD